LWSYAGQVKFSALNYEMDLTLARGLNYYTGAIFEVKADDSRTTFGSSICGGGRYDDLTGIFGLAGMSGVGISFGADRIADVMDEAGLFPEQISHSTDVLLMHLGEDELEYAVMLTDEVRRAGVKAELYPDAVKMKKQFSYADDRKIPFVVIAGRQEQEKGTVQIKNIITGQQEEVERAGLVAYLRKNIP
jgi:histidyl-tRNA synthetase